MNILGKSALILAFSFVFACDSNEDIASAATIANSPTKANEKNSSSSVAASSDHISNAVAHIERFQDDRAADERRNPIAALEFFKVTPSQTVFEIEAGTGYYTELLSRAVGPDGKIIMHNHERFSEFVNDDVKLRLENQRLANVARVVSSFDALEADDASVDIVTWVLGPHELYFTPSPEVSLGDPKMTFSEIVRIMKPGAFFVTIDHSAKDGAPTSTGNGLHRIDKQQVIELAEAAGLVLDQESDFLSNETDNLDMNIFDPTVRGKTNRFSLRFIKPLS